MNIDLENIPTKSKWLGALAIYCIVIANILWSFGSEAPIFTMMQWENGAETLHVSNVYHFWIRSLSYVAIIYMVVNAFAGSIKATTIWICLAASTFLSLYTLFGFCVLAYVLYPYAQRWMSAKFVQAVKSATTADIPPTE